MVVIEHYTTRPDGVDLDKAYSDKGYFILVDGVEYDAAIYPHEIEHEIKETKKKIPVEDAE